MVNEVRKCCGAPLTWFCEAPHSSDETRIEVEEEEEEERMSAAASISHRPPVEAKT